MQNNEKTLYQSNEDNFFSQISIVVVVYQAIQNVLINLV